MDFLILDPHGPFANFYSKDLDKMKTAEQKLKQARIVYSPHRGPGIRLSPHAYNRDEEIEYLLSSLK